MICTVLHHYAGAFGEISSKLVGNILKFLAILF